jgi:hypothetical protein
VEFPRDTQSYLQLALKLDKTATADPNLEVDETLVNMESAAG